MAFGDGEELIISVDSRPANDGIRGINTGLDRMERAAIKASGGASGGMDKFGAAALKSHGEILNLGRSGILAVEALEDQVVSLARESVSSPDGWSCSATRTLPPKAFSSLRRLSIIRKLVGNHTGPRQLLFPPLMIVIASAGS